MIYNEIMMQKGQIILALILIMTVALAIGLSIVQKSLTDVSTATKVEQSSRAFSAAEGGIEKYLSSNTDCNSQNCSVQLSETASTATVQGGNLIPAVAGSGTRQDPLEYPPLAKEEVAHVWLADPDSNVKLPDCTAIDPTGHSPVCYTQKSLDVYWGNSQTEKPAIELTLVYYKGTSYKPKKWYLDSNAAIHANDFDNTSANCGGGNKLDTSSDYKAKYGDSNYQCKITLTSLPAGLMLIRARLLYNSASQPFAVQAVEKCGTNCSLPPQAKILTSTGVTGETQRRVRVFQILKVVPPYFDYALFSAGDIRK